MSRNTGQNRWRGSRFRELVALALSTLGFEDAEPRPIAARYMRLSEALAATDPDEPMPTDVTGLPGVVLHVRADAQPQWSSNLDSVEQARDLAGAEHGVLVAYRRDRPALDAYVVMSLSGWARLAKQALAAEEVN